VLRAGLRLGFCYWHFSDRLLGIKNEAVCKTASPLRDPTSACVRLQPPRSPLGTARRKQKPRPAWTDASNSNPIAPRFQRHSFKRLYRKRRISGHWGVGGLFRLGASDRVLAFRASLSISDYASTWTAGMLQLT